MRALDSTTRLMPRVYPCSLPQSLSLGYESLINMPERLVGVYDYEGPPRIDVEGHIIYRHEVLHEDYSIPEVSDGVDAVISGGSMAGLFTAHALQQSGHEVNVYEKTPVEEMEGRGAGILTYPKLLRYMEETNLIEHREDVAFIIDQWDWLDSDGSVLARREYPTWSTSWDTFYKALHKAVGSNSYHSGTPVVDLEYGGDSASLLLGDGTTATGDLAIIAEGYNSPTRQRLLPDVSLQYAGYIAWRGIIPQHRLPLEIATYARESFVLFHGPDHVIQTYPVPGADGSTEKERRRVNLVWYWNIPSGEQLEDLLLGSDGVQYDGSLPPGKLRDEYYKRQLQFAEEEVPSYFAKYLESLDDLYVQCIYDLKIPRMVFDRACLLGDAAFFVRPQLAAGTVKAATDGITLAEEIGRQDSLDHALSTWEAGQKDLGERLVTLARERGDRHMQQTSKKDVI